MFDTYDFNANEGPLVEAGRRQITKDELDKIWNKK